MVFWVIYRHFIIMQLNNQHTQAIANDAIPNTNKRKDDKQCITEGEALYPNYNY